MKKLYCEKCNEYTEHEDTKCTACLEIYDPARKRYVITGSSDNEDTVKAREALLEKDPSAIIIPEDVALKHKMEGWKTFPTAGEPKIQRNQLCLCGSGKKYKKCCMNK
jgi:uncharacterized protein YchJ